MGYTNAVQIFHGDVCWILQDEIPDVTVPFIDDCPIKGLHLHYERPGRSFEMIPENPEIRCFIFKHLSNVNCVLQWLKAAGVKTGSSRSGTDERGKCDIIGLSAACPSNEATIRSVVVAVA